MDIEDYKRRRSELFAQAPIYRKICDHCRQPDFSCYCAWLKPFDPGIRFVILIHPIEARRRIATGRMAHLSLKNSHLITGQDFSENSEVNALLADPHLHGVLLYPGRQSQDIGKMEWRERSELLPSGKQLLVFVIDGTWATARKTHRLSQNLRALPKIAFVPSSPSNFRIRRQPRPECHSTIEAIYQTIDLLGPVSGPPIATRPHDHLLTLFDQVVNRQIELAHARDAVRKWDAAV